MNKVKQNITICWFRRDLRIEDQTAFYFAMKSEFPVLPLFVFDLNILSKLNNKSDRRVDFIYQSLELLNNEFRKHNSSLRIEYGDPLSVFVKLNDQYTIREIYCNEDYEPYSRTRDQIVEKWAKENSIVFNSFKDSVIFAPGEVLKLDGSPYTVYTPFSKRWKASLNSDSLSELASYQIHNMLTFRNEFIQLEDIGFEKTDLKFSIPSLNQLQLTNYELNRDYPSLDATSRLSVHLRFGTLSIRQLVKIAFGSNETFLNELIWREFFIQIMYFFPQIEYKPYRSNYENVIWNNDTKLFDLWKEGRTGFPLVDAGMRELSATGYMHNRVRMLTANFLSKILFIDWKLGEHWFAEKLLDFDLSLNNGNWQWSAGCGCDSAPYFRIFNPNEQIRKFDPEFKYIRKWVPEFDGFDYPKPIVDYKIQREKYLKSMSEYLKG